MKFKKLNRALAALLLGALALGCSPKHDPQTLVIGTEKAATTLDPRQATDFYSLRAARLIFDGLFKTDENLRIVNNLVASYVIDQQQTLYRLRLRHDVTFHDGTPLTSKDVKATYEHVLNPQNKSVYRNAFEKIASITLIDDHQLEIKLREADATFLTAMIMGIVPHRFENAPFAPIGSGPYQVDKDLGQDGLRLLRYEAYQPKPPSIAKIFIKPVLEDSVRVLGLLKGSIDLLQNVVPPMLISKVAENPEINLEKTPGLVYAYVGFNFKDPILKVKKVREAMAYALNRQEIIRFKLHGLATEADTPLAPIHYMHAGNLKSFGFEPQLAKQLLDEAGFKDPDGDGPKMRFNLVYKSSTNPERMEIAKVLVDQWSKVGIGVELKPLEFGAFFADIKSGNFQIYTLEFSSLTSEDIYTSALHSDSVPPNGVNRGYYSNEVLDKLLEAGRREADLTKRQAIYKKVQDEVAQDLPYISLWYRLNVVASRKRLQNYRATPQGDYEGVLAATLLP